MSTPARKASVERKTGETHVTVSINLDGTGQSSITTGVGFLDHMLALLAKHSMFDLDIAASGDHQVDDHHTVEDVGITLGQAFDKALGEKKGIARFACTAVPMDEALARCSLDLSGRAYLVLDAKFPTQKVGSFDVELTGEFLQALAANARMTLHVDVIRGDNSHHIIEAIFKSLARVLGAATRTDPRRQDVPSTKGVL
jgi:imidazoleglycerol-phosphate dehydratase